MIATQANLLDKNETLARLERESVKIIRLTLAVICLLLLCSCATEKSLHPQLPADVTMNKDAGRGGWLTVMLRLESGEELPFDVDTGAPVTFFDKSMEPKLGKCFGPCTFSNFGVKRKGGRYAVPKLYLGNTALTTGSRVCTCDLKQLSSDEGRPIMGILGMDCLRHYCLQLDFEGRKMRFLDPNCLDTAILGRAFPITFSSKGQGIVGFIMGFICPFVYHGGLIGGEGSKLLVDTGSNGDGELEPRILERETQAQKVVFTLDKRTWFPQCVWNSETYTNLLIGKGENSIGLRFLARHLVTFDFPKRMMYLKQTSIGPLAGDSFTKGEAAARSAGVATTESAVKFLEGLMEKGQLLGWAKDEKGPVTIHFHWSEENPESATCDMRRNGDLPIYHYTVTRASKNSPWKLQKAWRTDTNGHMLEEYLIP